MVDRFNKIVLVGIFLCLLIIAFKPTKNYTSTLNPNLSVNEGKQVIQLAPNRIAVVDTSPNSGMKGTILVFEYVAKTNSFTYVSSMNYVDYFRNPQKYGLNN